MKKEIFILLLISLSIKIIFADSNNSINSYFPKDSWRISSAEKQNMNNLHLKRMHDVFDPQGQIVVIKNGYLIESKNKINFEKIEHVHSCTKSVISLLYGMVLTTDSVYTPMVDFFPQYKRKDNKNVTLYHLLSMTSGMDWSDNPNIDSIQLTKEDDWVNYILSKKIIKTPGNYWNYNSGGSQILSVIIQKKLTYPLINYVEEQLFRPLGIKKYSWWESNDGYLTAGWGLHLRVLDITKIGYLMLNNGQWNGQTVINRQWIQEASSRKAKVNKDFSYGFQWWIYDSLPIEAFKAYGRYGDHSVMIIIIPQHNLEIVLIGNIHNDIEILSDYIIPSLDNMD
jgi:CubicO group peptidase (beta-lactamase class C family)